MLDKMIETRYNLYEKGDIHYSIKVKGSIGSRFFINEESAIIAYGIYLTLYNLDSDVVHSEWEMLTRCTLRLIDSSDRW